MSLFSGIVRLTRYGKQLASDLRMQGNLGWAKNRVRTISLAGKLLGGPEGFYSKSVSGIFRIGSGVVTFIKRITSKSVQGSVRFSGTLTGRITYSYMANLRFTGLLTAYKFGGKLLSSILRVSSSIVTKSLFHRSLASSLRTYGTLIVALLYHSNYRTITRSLFIFAGTVISSFTHYGRQFSKHLRMTSSLVAAKVSGGFYHYTNNLSSSLQVSGIAEWVDVTLGARIFLRALEAGTIFLGSVTFKRCITGGYHYNPATLVSSLGNLNSNITMKWKKVKRHYFATVSGSIYCIGSIDRAFVSETLYYGVPNP